MYFKVNNIAGERRYTYFYSGEVEYADLRRIHQFYETEFNVNVLIPKWEQYQRLRRDWASRTVALVARKVSSAPAIIRPIVKLLVERKVSSVTKASRVLRRADRFLELVEEFDEEMDALWDSLYKHEYTPSLFVHQADGPCIRTITVRYNNHCRNREMQHSNTD